MGIDVLAGSALFLANLVEVSVMLAAVQYLMGEADVFDALRHRLPEFLQAMFACPSCLGFWLGMAAGGLLGAGPWAVGATPWSASTAWGAAGLTGLAAVALVPMVRGLMALGWAVADPGPAVPHEHGHVHEEGAGDGEEA